MHRTKDKQRKYKFHFIIMKCWFLFYFHQYVLYPCITCPLIMKRSQFFYSKFIFTLDPEIFQWTMQWIPTDFKIEFQQFFLVNQRREEKWFLFRKHIIPCGNCILAFLLNRSKLNIYECVDDGFLFECDKLKSETWKSVSFFFPFGSSKFT